MKVLVVHCHPVEDSYTAAMRDAALAGLHQGGHEVELIDLYAEGFRPELSAREWAGHADGVRDPDLDRHARLLRWAEGLVLVYPTWWGSQPGMLKGWFDRVWCTGVAYDLRDGKLIGRLRSLRRILLVTTHGSTRRMNLVQGEPGKRLVRRSLRYMCHPLARIRWLAIYGLDHIDDEQRRHHLGVIEQRCARPGL